MTRELNRVTWALLAAFVLIALSAAYWTVIGADSLLARDDNARNVIAEQRIRRGAIFDRNGERLAYSQESISGVMQRVYPYPAVVGAVGYYSLTYGTAGIEGAFDATLRGDDQLSEWDEIKNAALHQSQQGSDVQTTLDLDIQQAASEALRGRTGAVVVVEIPSGGVLALVSQPDYDPNTLDRNWDALTENRRVSPLLNRATAGLYQPGGVFETVILAALLAEHPALEAGGEMVLNTAAPDAQSPVEVGRLVLACLPETPQRALTLAEAYVYGCPAPFTGAFATTLTPERLWDRFGELGLLDAPRLIGFETTAGRHPIPFTADTSTTELTSVLAGQGDLTITPLQLAQVISVIANRGNAVPLHLGEATRLPGASDWQALDLPVMQPAMLRADVAAAVRLAMLQAAARSTYVGQALRGDQVLYGHSALAYGGPDRTPAPLVWFAGFVEPAAASDAASAVVVIVVIEDESDPGVAAAAAGEIFAAVQR
jgi:peptidoglycan glycosyltransferase